MAVTLDDAFVAELAASSADRDPVGGMDAVVQFVVGKSAQAVASIVDGRIVGEGSLDDGAEPDARLVFTSAQAQALRDGSMDLAVDYMRGDFKPTGSTRAIAAAILALTPPG